MIRSVDLPKDRWMEFLRMLDRSFMGRPIHVEVMGRTLGDQELTEHNAFRGIDYDTKGSERGSLTLTVGMENGGVLTHRIIDPTRLYFGMNESGQIEWLAISEKGEVGDAQTLVHFEEWLELAEDFERPPTP